MILMMNECLSILVQKDIEQIKSQDACLIRASLRKYTGCKNSDSISIQRAKQSQNAEPR